MFCDPQAPWQKGSVENLNKRARRYLPRDAPVSALSNRDMKSICDRLRHAQKVSGLQDTGRSLQR
jgi:transposase, IS30 family